MNAKAHWIAHIISFMLIASLVAVCFRGNIRHSSEIGRLSTELEQSNRAVGELTERINLREAERRDFYREFERRLTDIKNELGKVSGGLSELAARLRKVGEKVWQLENAVPDSWRNDGG